jgi:hypothetical protein
VKSPTLNDLKLRAVFQPALGAVAAAMLEASEERRRALLLVAAVLLETERMLRESPAGPSTPRIWFERACIHALCPFCGPAGVAP